VVCFSPRHDLSLPELSQAAVEAVVETWTAQTHDLGRRADINYVQVFENKGAQMGASNPHPHSQVWASAHIPNEPAKELAAQAAYEQAHGRCLLCDYARAELEAPAGSASRVVTLNDHWLAVVPFWAVWPFETLLVSRRHAASLGDLTAPEKSGLADALRRLTARYDNLFQVSFPYSMGFHQPPTDGSVYPSWHLHAHFYPPLFRSASIRKFMVGYELLAMPQRDLTPETAAERLRTLSERHFRLP
jgi:UDPglucose--hexose-1-phosphate uridylyltransferase